MESREQWTTFLVERYRPDGGHGRLVQEAASLGAALRDLERQGELVRFVCAVSVPDDGSLLFVLEASSLALVHRVCAGASVAASRISVAVAESADAPVPRPRHPITAQHEPQRST